MLFPSWTCVFRCILVVFSVRGVLSQIFSAYAPYDVIYTILVAQCLLFRFADEAKCSNTCPGFKWTYLCSMLFTDRPAFSTTRILILCILISRFIRFYLKDLGYSDVNEEFQELTQSKILLECLKYVSMRPPIADPHYKGVPMTQRGIIIKLQVNVWLMQGKKRETLRYQCTNNPQKNFSLKNFMISLIKEYSPQNIIRDEFKCMDKYRSRIKGINRRKIQSNLGLFEPL